MTELFPLQVIIPENSYQTCLIKKQAGKFLSSWEHGPYIERGLGAALNSKADIILDGDGSLLMHMGSFINLQLHKKFEIYLLNNNYHRSVGGQINNIRKIQICQI